MKPTIFLLQIVFVLVSTSALAETSKEAAWLRANSYFGCSPKQGQGLCTKTAPAASNYYKGVKNFSFNTAFDEICPPDGEKCFMEWSIDNLSDREVIEVYPSINHSGKRLRWIFPKDI